MYSSDNCCRFVAIVFFVVLKKVFDCEPFYVSMGCVGCCVGN